MKCASCLTCCEHLNRIKLSSKIASRITGSLQFIHYFVLFKEHDVSELELIPCSGQTLGCMYRVCGRQSEKFAISGLISNEVTMDKFREQVILTTLISN